MFSKLNIYLVLKANFNSKFMFSKLNIQFTEHSVYRTLLYRLVCSLVASILAQYSLM